MYSFRKADVIGQIRARTTRFKTSFYPDCLSEWNKVDPEIRLSPSLNIFKTKLSKLIRSTPKLVYGIRDPKGLAILTQSRVGLSKLNFHGFGHNFRDTVNPLCPTNDGGRGHGTFPATLSLVNGPTMPAKSLGTPLQILSCFAISPSPPQNNVVLWSKNRHDRTIRDSAAMLGQ